MEQLPQVRACFHRRISSVSRRFVPLSLGESRHPLKSSFLNFNHIHRAHNSIVVDRMLCVVTQPKRAALRLRRNAAVPLFAFVCDSCLK